MNLYCSYLGPFVELKEPKIVKKTIQESFLCKNKGCSSFGHWKPLHLGGYCSICGNKFVKEKMIYDSVPTINSLTCENREMIKFDIISFDSFGLKKYFLVLKYNDDKYSGRCYQNNQNYLVDQELIDIQKLDYKLDFDKVKETINNNFESISEIQYGWIKFEVEDGDY